MRRLAACARISKGRAPVGDDLIVLALSGGGARAASFHLGVLQALARYAGPRWPAAERAYRVHHIGLRRLRARGLLRTARRCGARYVRCRISRREWRVRGPSSPFGIAGAFRGGMNGPSAIARLADRECLYGDAAWATWRRAARHSQCDRPLQLDAVRVHAILLRWPVQRCAPGARCRRGRGFDGGAGGVPPSAHGELRRRAALARRLGQRACSRIAARARMCIRRRTRFRIIAAIQRAQQRFVHLVDGGVADNLGMLSLQVMRDADERALAADGARSAAGAAGFVSGGERGIHAAADVSTGRRYDRSARMR
jgi:hypothetical protein